MRANLISLTKKREEDHGKAQTLVPACTTGPELDVTQSQHPAHLSFTFHLKLKLGRHFAVIKPKGMIILKKTDQKL